MPKEISALNTFWLVEYLAERHPEIDLEGLIQQLISSMSMPCHVENIYSGDAELITLSHLKNPRYWFSHQFVKSLYDLVESNVGDPRLGYKIGSAMYKSKPLVRTSLGLSLLGVHGVVGKISSEAAKYNCTKKYLPQKQDKGYVEIRIVHVPGIVISEFTMQWNAGCFASYAKLAGATDISVDLQCIDPGPVVHGEKGRAVWDFYIRYQEPPLLTRVGRALLRSLPWIRQMTEEAEAIEAEHQDQIHYRDKIIQERTEALLQIQQRLLEEERRGTENRLRTISRELVCTEERERKVIAEGLHDSVTQLLALSLKKVKSMEGSSDDLQTLGELREHLEQSLAELRSLTFQISPPVLYDFGLEAALEWLVEDVNRRHGMQLIFANLTSSALVLDREQRAALYRVVRELLINIMKHAKTVHGQVILREENGLLIVEVDDEGVGFDVESSKVGFGLSAMTDRLLCVQGTVRIDSTPGEGTFAKILVPLSTSVASPVTAAADAGTAAITGSGLFAVQGLSHAHDTLQP